MSFGTWRADSAVLMLCLSRFVSTLQDCLQRTADRPEALRIAYRECGITMTAMAKELQLSVSRISRPIAAAEAVEVGWRQKARPDPVTAVTP